MQKIRLITTLLFVDITAFIALSFLLPTPPYTNASPLEFHIRIALMLALALFYFAAAVLFAASLVGFKKDVKVAYTIISIGVIGVGLTSLQYPVYDYLGLLYEPWVPFTGVLPGIVADILILVGVRRFARLFTIRSFFLSGWFVCLVVGLLAPFLIFAPHGASTVPELWFDVWNVVETITIGALGSAAIGIFLVRQKAGPSFTKALNWFFVALSFTATFYGCAIISDLLGTDHWLVTSRIIIIPFLLSGLFFIKAGYEFNKIAHYTGSKAQQTNRLLIDVVVFVANLASNPKDVDPILDDLRAITARLKPDEQLSSEDQTILMRVYLNLEDYLITSELIRAFTADELRQKVRARFNLQPNTADSWLGLFTKTTKQ